MAARALRVLLALLVASCAALELAAPALAATWWVAVPGAPRGLTQIAAGSSSPTLAIVHGGAGWLWPLTGRYRGLALPDAAFVASLPGGSGLVQTNSGQLLEVDSDHSRRLGYLPGRPLGMAVGPGTSPWVVAITTSGIYQWRPPGLPHPVAGGRGNPVAVAPPASSAYPFVIAERSGEYLLRPGGRLVSSRGSPQLGSGAKLAELADGVILAAARSGVVWGLYRNGWQAAFQVLPAGGFSGVPSINGLVAVSGSAAYLATSGFGTLLTPDGGYSWYRADLPGTSSALQVSTLGPVLSSDPRGNVLAVTPAGLYRHHLQPLPTPPQYSGTAGSMELVLTSLVTVAAAALVILLMWAWRRHQLRRGFV
ncbi:MAG: hypothetical protein M0T72_04765 [Candidatus Dormibacteraeota bacterium]|nr:hypothetical protein [Candidatus Dormibacteraeota bacterium]